MSRESRRRQDEAARQWKGAYRPYDIVPEATIALGVVLALTLVLTILFSSPDDPPSTIKQWARTDPVDFVTTATTELDGSSGTGGTARPTTTPLTVSTSRSYICRSGSESAIRSIPPTILCSRRCAVSADELRGEGAGGVVMLLLAVIHGTMEWQAVADRVVYTRYKNVYFADGLVWTQSARQ